MQLTAGKPHLWVRAEQKQGEQRCALNPPLANKLIAAGFSITVERSSQRIIPEQQYAQAGCQLIEAGSWKEAPSEAWILGLKELADDDFPLTHRHIHFAHAYKEQPGWARTLERFKSGRGQLYDIEYLVDGEGRRVAAFGYWAGFAGAALALHAWAGQVLDHQPALPAVHSYPDKTALLNELAPLIADAISVSGRSPKALVVGALGRSGLGAIDCLQVLGLAPEEWDIEETRAGGPFAEILDADIFLNCVLINKPISPFLQPAMLDNPGRKLSVICDISCDPTSQFNPLPIYDSCTSFANPLIELRSEPVLGLISIDHLPSLLPLESSNDFIEQLAPHFFQLELNPDSGDETVWGRALGTFNEKLTTLPG